MAKRVSAIGPYPLLSFFFIIAEVGTELGFTVCTAIHAVTSKNYLELFDFKMK